MSNYTVTIYSDDEYFADASANDQEAGIHTWLVLEDPDGNKIEINYGPDEDDETALNMGVFNLDGTMDRPEEREERYEIAESATIIITEDSYNNMLSEGKRLLLDIFSQTD